MIVNLGPNKIDLETVEGVGEPYLNNGDLVVPVLRGTGKTDKYIVEDITVYDAFKAEYDEFCGVEPEPVDIEDIEPSGELEHVSDLELDVDPEVAEEVLEEADEDIETEATPE